MTGPDARLMAAIAAAVLVHIGLAGGMHAANRFFTRDTPPPPMEVTLNVQPPPPPPPPEPEPPPPPPEEPVPQKTPPPTPPPKQPKAKQPPPPADQPPPPPDQPPAEPAPEAAPQKVYEMALPGGTVVNPGAANGTATGRPNTKGTAATGSQEGGTGTSQGTSIAAIKSMPRPTGDYDYVDLGKEYPDAARRQGIEGEATYRIFVDENGNVTQVKMVKKLGFGLDEKGVELIRRIKFEPARDTNDKAVGVWRSWSIQFTLPQ
jgi:periplasmic protein TonB